MFFGLCNSLAMFQTMMNTIFHDLIIAQVITVYMDDILIFTKTVEEHRQVTTKVMEILLENDLFLKPSKCTFEADQVEYLGFIISADSIAMDPVKSLGHLGMARAYNPQRSTVVLGLRQLLPPLHSRLRNPGASS